MAWENAEWSCGHEGRMKLYGRQRDRESRVAREAGRQCMACWLVGEWERGGDPRAGRTDRYQLAAKIAEGKGIRIDNLPDTAPVAGDRDALVTEQARLLARLAEIDRLLEQA